MSSTILLSAFSARAEVPARKLTVLRATTPALDPAHSAAIDVALDDALARLERFTSVDVLPVPLEDVQLAAGCFTAPEAHEGPRIEPEIACLHLMADQLGVDALLVRQLASQGETSVVLTILVHDATLAFAEPRRAEAVLSTTSAQDSKHAVQAVLSQLLPRAPQLGSSGDANQLRRTLGWTLSAVGTSLLVAGLTCSARARHHEKSYADVDIEDEQDVDHAQDLLRRAERLARFSNVFLGTGAAITAVGIASLVWPFALRRNDTTLGSLSIQSSKSGAMLLFHGAWQGGR